MIYNIGKFTTTHSLHT